MPAKAGHTRFLVPLRHPGPWQSDEDGEGLGERGPAVSPGDYRVRVTADSESATAELRVVMDPRTREIGVTGDDLQAQEALALRVRDLLSRANRLLARVEEAMAAASGAELERLEARHRRLTEREDHAYPQPMLVEQIEYLYGMVTAAAQAPGEDAFIRYEELLEAVEAEVAERAR